MKIKELRQIIKEEYVNVLAEAFADPNIRKVSKMGGMQPSKYNNWFKKFAHTHDIAWDKLPAGTLTKSTNMNDPMIKKGLAFWVNTSSKPNPFASNRYWDTNIPQGVMAVTLSGKVQYDGQSGVGAKGTSRYGDASGHGKRGTLQLKKLKDIADEVYVMDMEMFRGGTKALKAKRADLKLGKDTFKDARGWKAANLARYKDIMNARVGNRDTVDAMVAKIVKIANEAITSGMELIKVGKYDELETTINGNPVPMNAVTSAMTRALRSYAEYIRYANDAEKEKESGYGSSYYDKSSKETAGYIKKILNAFEAGNANDISRY
tara:strand:+ start:2338 stop:3297 length:960 start_codon:yes stop_codon:yes gene_type:complete